MINIAGKFGKISSIAMVAAVLALIPRADAQVVALGDSNISGPGISSSETYPAQLQGALIARGKNVTVRNAGVIGDTTTDVLRRVDGDVPQGTKVVVLWVGINDSRRGVPPATTASNLAAINSKLRARGIAVYRVPQSLAASLHKPGFIISDNRHFNGAGYAKVVAATLPAIERLVR
jgi:acyl-CoA thioesterase-1